MNVNVDVDVDVDVDVNVNVNLIVVIVITIMINRWVVWEIILATTWTCPFHSIVRFLYYPIIWFFGYILCIYIIVALFSLSP